MKKKTFILWCQQICKEFTELYGMTIGNFTFTNSIFLALYQKRQSKIDIYFNKTLDLRQEIFKYDIIFSIIFKTISKV